ncbi:PD-(D/E)XK nuclease family protein [Candidatus Dojkabacteria bacterium]|jgi:hypothetical protein|nr:PD-(D/E)XK nuclease family protein [Candidatus Dojkabacteria bacterium]
MSLTYFDCSAGKNTLISDCLKNCPLPTGRCLSLPTLTSIGYARKWSGHPSTTQLLNPTRIEYLQIKHPYSVDPFNQAFALLGTRHHGRLEQVAKKIEGLQSELFLKGEVSGIVDLIEPINDTDTYRLIDYKTFGSYSVAKHLDIKDDQGDKHKLALQMNNYRIMAEKLGFKIVELKVQITVRDGGTYSAKDNKIFKNLYLLNVEILPDEDVTEYFNDKSFKLCQAVEKDEMPELCPYLERWGGRRCKGYCNVFRWCEQGAKVNKVELGI